jgi:serine/threonine protein kinase
MGFFAKLKFCKTPRTSRTGFLRRIVKCILPCIKRKTRSPSPENSRDTKENKNMENCKEKTHQRTCAQYEALIHAERQREIIDIRRMTRQVKNSPHTPQIEGISMQENQQGHRREERALCLEDFKIKRTLGEGGFGQVLLAKKKNKCGHTSSEELFAIKRVRNESVSAVEKEVLLRAVGHPFLAQMFSYFQTNEDFCYVMEYYEGGTLLSMITRLQKFHEDLARFYAAEIILAVNFLHKCGIVHRDIKPDNILLDRDGHCRLADFGLAELGMFKGMRTIGRCGTVRYMAPEVLQRRQYGPEVDWWSVGRVMLHMMVGKCPEEYIPHTLRLTNDADSILKMFLEIDPKLRLGARGDIRSIFTHPFFKSVNWEEILEKRIKPPVKSELVSALQEAPGDIDESGTEISFKTAYEEQELEGAVHKTQNEKCANVDL